MTAEKDPQKYIQECLEWIARRKAFVDQREKMYTDQYPMRHAITNHMRLNDLEAMRFEIEFNEYELGGFIKDYIDNQEDE